MSKTELKPCPFCGGEAKIATYDWGYSVKEYWVYCSCGCETKKFHSKEEAVENWNTRKPMDNIVAELEELKADEYYKAVEGDRDAGVRNNAYVNAIDIVKRGGAE